MDSLTFTLADHFPCVRGTASTDLPSGPAVILCPNSLVGNWIEELHRWMEPRAVDIMAYTNETVRLFWTDNGPWHQSKQSMERRIIVAAASVCTSIIHP
jgi:SNF2 family DNA or RNA helicase